MYMLLHQVIVICVQRKWRQSRKWVDSLSTSFLLCTTAAVPLRWRVGRKMTEMSREVVVQGAALDRRPLLPIFPLNSKHLTRVYEQAIARALEIPKQRSVTETKQIEWRKPGAFKNSGCNWRRPCVWWGCLFEWYGWSFLGSSDKKT